MKKKLITTLMLCVSFILATANPVDLNAKIKKFINEKYNKAVIIEMEHSNGKVEVEIIHDKREKELVFNDLGVWQSTKYDILKSELPKKIKKVVKSSIYSSYSIDEVEVIETKEKSLYEIELTKLLQEDVVIYVTFEGEIL